MSKLPKQHQFIDLSDYGRPFARFIANSLVDTHFTPIHVTTWFIIAGFLAIACIFYEYYWAAAFFLVLKSILDAADGELARIKKTPSYTGRYYDSVADIILNFLFLSAIWYVTNASISMLLLAFVSVQLQGTLYNYYYVILRNKFNGDQTSRIFETKTPTALPGEKQAHVNILFGMYNVLYRLFDRTIYYLDKGAVHSQHFPKWFMTAVSAFGLGFQLLIIALLLVVNMKAYILPFFVAYSALIFVFILLRKWLNRSL